MKKLKVLLKMTGSIACYKACNLISKLVQEGHEVQVVASAAALKFVGEATLEGLSGKRVATDTFESDFYMDHIYLDRWADVVVVAPASANFLNACAAGVANDLIHTLFLAHDFSKPYIVAPAMNSLMYSHSATQASMKKLQEMGVQIMDTASGTLACGEVGEGKLIDPDLIYKKIISLANAAQPIASKGAVIITAGGTQEPIDSVRYITNFSSGKTGSLIADELVQAGFEVYYLHSKTAVVPSHSCNNLEFSTFADLENQLRSLLSKNKIMAVVHAAAVSDFSVDNYSAEKISSDSAPQITFKRNPKIINQLREYSHNKDLKVIGFKLTATNDVSKQKVALEKIFKSAQPNLVIHNDMNEISKEQHPFYVYRSEKDLLTTLGSQKQLAQYIGRWLGQEAAL